ncbi:MAG: LysR family transcriptional regulator [Pseudomonadota bacterium]
MDERLRTLDWSLVRAFLAVAEEGSLSAAARRLGASQPTLGRQVKAIEDALRARLFARHAKGLALTEMGEAILPAARAMARAMNDIRVAAAARETELTGSVRITASVNVAFTVVPPVIATARRRYPGVQIDLVPSDDSENLTFGDSDIAVRMYRPEQPDLITQFLGTFDIGLYAGREFLDRMGRPESVAEIFELDLVGYDTDRRILDGMIARGFPARRDMFATRCDDPLTQWELVAAGCGIGFAPCAMGDRDPRVDRVPLPFEIEGLPMWLTTSEAMRRTPRIRAIWDVLAAELGPGPSA